MRLYATTSLRGNRRRLDVVVVEVLLEVEDRERVRLLDRKELAERRIGLDRLLVHQAVRLRVRDNTLRDLRAADERALRLAEERAEVIRDNDRLLEDNLTDRRGRAIRVELRAALAAAIRALGEAGDLLLKSLERRERRRVGGLRRRQLREDAGDRLRDGRAEVLLGDGNNRLRDRRHDRGRGRGRSHNRCRRCNSRRRRCSGLRGLRRLRCRNRNRNRNRCGGGNSNRRINYSLRRLLRRRLRGGAHFASIGGRNGRHGTRMITRGVLSVHVNFAAWPPKVATKL